MLTNGQLNATVRAVAQPSCKLAYALNNITWTPFYNDCLKLYTKEEKHWRKTCAGNNQPIGVLPMAKIRLLNDILEFILEERPLPELKDYHWMAKRVFITATVCDAYRDRILNALSEFDTKNLLAITREFLDDYEY